MNYSFYEEMDELDDILSESDEIEDIIESVDELFEEKATRDEYVMRRFKEKYKYNPSDSTIEVDGKRYKVKFPSKSGVMTIDNNSGVGPNRVAMQNRMSMDTVLNKDGAIMLDETFFALKDDKRRDALLKHEIGHSKLHSTMPGYKHTDTSKISKEMIINEIDTQCKNTEDTIRKAFGNEYSDELINDYMKSTRQQLLDSVKGYMACSTASEAQSKIRADARKAANKYVPKQRDDGVDRSHASAKEYEADRYAANHSNERSVKRGIREFYKISSKPKNVRKALNSSAKADAINQKAIETNKNADQVKVSKSEVNKSLNDAFNSDPTKPKQTRAQIVKDQQKQLNKSGSYDYAIRSKALKDKDLRNNPSLK